MNRKLCLFALAIVFLAVSVGSVQASVNIGINASPTGTVPLNTIVTITVNYTNTNKMSAAPALLMVWYRASQNGAWTPKLVLFAKIIQSFYSGTFTYKLAKPGYYKFTWTVLDWRCETKTVCARVGPVLPEPAPIAGLAVSIAALGLVFTRKRFTK